MNFKNKSFYFFIFQVLVFLSTENLRKLNYTYINNFQEKTLKIY